MAKLLTKSKFLYGVQCKKYLWHVFHKPEMIPPPDQGTQFIFSQGNEVDSISKKVFANGLNAESDKGFMPSIKLAKFLLRHRRPLYEAGFMAKRCYARVDILAPAENDTWDIVEVKSGTSVKDINLFDIAFQRYCLVSAGIPINKCYLMFLNNQYVRDGAIDLEKLFVREDVTEAIAHIDVAQMVSEMLEIIDSPDCPSTPIGKHCADPYPCPLKQHCWEFVPENNVFELYRGGKKSFQLFDQGVLKLIDIPENTPLNEKQQIQVTCAKQDSTHIDHAALTQFLGGLTYPLSLLDFETYATAIPLYDGLKPYQAIPFQFSLHTLDHLDDEPHHVSFIAPGSEDPRKKFIDALKLSLPESGSIVVYNEAFEKARLRELGELFPEHKQWIDGVVDRFVDLLVPFRSFHYYHPSQKGSASIKKVLPAITGKGYDTLAIGSGDIASIMYHQITHTRVSDEERERVRTQLELYCGQDTEGLIWILREIARIVTP